MAACTQNVETSSAEQFWSQLLPPPHGCADVEALSIQADEFGRNLACVKDMTNKEVKESFSY